MNTDTLITQSARIVSPPITKMIRLDHSHALVVWHKYRTEASPRRKAAIVDHVCRALEVHAQLEEEIFYPALREAAPGHPVLQKSVPEHDEMRAAIATLRGMDADDPAYDSTFAELMCKVMHHVADEEAVLLPLAEQLLADRLDELGAQMTRRRMTLLKPHAGELAMSTARAMPVATTVATVAIAGAIAGIVWALAGRREPLHRHRFGDHLPRAWR